TAPIAKSLASHISSKGISQFGAIKIGASHSFVLSVQNASTHSGEKMNGASFSRSRVIGLAIFEMSLMKDLMAKDYTFLHHKVTLLPIQNRLVSSPFKHLVQMRETTLERIPENREVIHKHFHGFLDHIMEDSHHTPLKRAWSVA
nr:hypothetical protein [Tanacetum cinerariifolium]